MPSMNAVRLYTNAQPAAGVELISAVQQVQGYREQQITFWILVTGAYVSGSVQIRGAPDLAAKALTSPEGAILNSVIWTGTAGNDQTKVNGQGHAVVVVQAHPLMWLRIQGTGGTEIVNAWMIE